MTPKTLTPSQRRVLLALWRLTREFGHPPTLCEMADYLGRSFGRVDQVYTALAVCGCLTRQPAEARSAVPRGWLLVLPDPDRVAALSPAEGEALVKRLARTNGDAP